MKCAFCGVECDDTICSRCARGEVWARDVELIPDLKEVSPEDWETIPVRKHRKKDLFRKTNQGEDGYGP